MEIEFCIFVARVLDNDLFNEINSIHNQLHNKYNINIKQIVQETDINKEITQKKLNDLGIPNSINTSTNNINDINHNTIEKLTSQFNDCIKNKCIKKLFIMTMDNYDTLLNKFNEISNTDILEFPDVNGFKLLGIIHACSINATEEYMAKNSGIIGDSILETIEKQSKK